MHEQADAESDDEDLMVRYAGGDAEAFEELFARYESRAYGFMLRRVRSEARAADLYQELFLRIHRARASYDPNRPFAPWFFEIARRLVIDDLRRTARWREETFAEETLPTALDTPAQAEASLACHEEAQAVLGRLSELERYVLISAKVDGRPYAELAVELGRSVVAIKKLASRAMQRLRALHAGAFDRALPAAN